MSPKFPPGYAEREREFCKAELAKFYEHDNDEWREKHRQAVLDKREQFKNEHN
jgi:hypothetical protein